MSHHLDRDLAVSFEAEAVDACFSTSGLEAYLAGDRTTLVTRRLAHHLRHCERCLRVLAFAEVPPPRVRARPSVGMWASAALVLVAASVGASRFGESEPAFVGKGEIDENMATIATAGDEIHVAIQRGDLTFRASPGDLLLEGDLLRVFYSTRDAGWLGVWNVDAAGAITALSGGGVTSMVRVGPGMKVALDGGALVGSGGRCEWLVGAFADAPLDAGSIASLRARNKPVAGPECELQIELEGARTVIVLPFRR